MRDFVAGRVAATDFVAGYEALRNSQLDAHAAALNAHPEVVAAARDLDRGLAAGRMGPAEYEARLGAVYDGLDELEIPPGSAEAGILDRVYVQVDSWEEGEPDSQLQSDVASALEELDGLAL
jgi:hypothetical protein